MTNPIIKYHSNGNKESESYYLNNKFHNDNGPACIFYYKNGIIYSNAFKGYRNSWL